MAKESSGPDPAQPDRRKNQDRRKRLRGGRRRADWPEDAGLTGCPRCGARHLKLVSVTTHVYEWHCRECKRMFTTGRASRVVL